MKTRSAFLTAGLLLSVAASVSPAEINIQYLGAFRATPGTGIYSGDITFNPAGNGGLGSLYISNGNITSSKEIYEITIPALVNTTSISALNTAATLRSFDVNTAPTGLVLRSTDGLLYYSTGVAGSPQVPFRYCNADGTGESAVRYGPAWSAGGAGMCEIPSDWANTYAGAKNLLSIGNFYGARIYSCDPWNSAVTWTTLVGYDSSHLMNGYDYADAMNAITWVSIAGEANVVIGGKKNSTSQAYLWFYRAADLQNPAQTYTPQPYKTLSVQDKMLVTGSNALYGLTYDATHQIMYSYEGGYQQPAVVHAWQIVDLPPSTVTDLAATPTDWFSVNLAWTAPSDDHGPSGAAAGYDIRYSTAAIDGTNWDSAAQVTGEPVPAAAGQAQSFTVTGLQASTQYYFALKATDANGNVSALSNVPFATTNPLDVAAPAAVSNLAYSAVKPNRVTLSWSATGDDDATGQAGSYDLRYSTSPINDSNWSGATAATGLTAPKAPGSAESFVLRGLAPSTTYYVAIKVADEVPNWSGVSNVVTFTTSELDVTPPPAINNLGAIPDIHAVYLSWTAPADIGSAGLDGYDVRYSTSTIDDSNWSSATQCTGEPTPGTPGTTDRFTVLGLTASTTYYFAIKSYDSAEPANVSTLSNVVSVTTRPPIVPVTVHNPWLVNDRVADTHNITTMGATYGNAYTPSGVVPPANDEAKAINIYNNQKRRLYHWGTEPPSVGSNSIDDPTYNQNVFGWCLCGRHASQACTIVNASGMTERKIAFPGHWTYEVQFDGLWHQFDTMCTHYIYTRDVPPHIACSQDIKNDSSLEFNAVMEGRACPGYLLCGDTAQDYVTFCNSWSSSGSGAVATRWNGNMDLRIGQIFKRTCESWANQYPTTSGDPPFHHEASRDYKDWVNFPYWEPYRVDMVYYGSGSPRPTYRRWSNGTDTLAPDFRSAAYQAMLEPTSHDIASYYQDAVTPDLHGTTVGTMGEAIFKIAVPFYITDASFSGDFVKTNTTDSCEVLISTNGSTWTSVYSAGLGTSHVTGQSLRSSVFGLWQAYWIKIQVKGTFTKSDAGVSNFILTTIFEHNKGALPYLDHGVNHITLTFDNAAELAASGNVLHVTYKWKEYDGTDWTIDKQYDGFFTTSPVTFTITTGGASRPRNQPDKSYDVTPPAGSYPAVPRTEYIAMEITQPDLQAPDPIADVAATPASKTSVTLTWTATGDDGSSGKASRYDIRYSTSPITDVDSFNAAAAATGLPMPQMAGSPESFTVTGLSANTTYYFAVQAIDKGVNYSGLVSGSTATATTLPDTPPAPVADLAAPPAGQLRNSIQLTWTATGEDGSVGTAKSYDLRYSTGTIASMADFNAATQVVGEPTPKASGLAETFTVTGLTVATTYNFALVVYDNANQPSGLSNVLVAWTAADTRPMVVTDLAVAAGSFKRDSVSLTWTATGEDGSVGTASHYDLRYNTSPISDMTGFNAATMVPGLPAPKPAGQTETFAVTGLSAGTTYYFGMVVYDAANQASGLSNIVMAQTRKLGDIDGDGQVNLADLKLIVAAWNSEGGGAYANWNPDADLDGDNFVNLADLKILVAHWNQ